MARLLVGVAFVAAALLALAAEAALGLLEHRFKIPGSES